MISSLTQISNTIMTGVSRNLQQRTGHVVFAEKSGNTYRLYDGSTGARLSQREFVDIYTNVSTYRVVENVTPKLNQPPNPRVERPFELFGAEETFGYLRRKIEPEFRLPVEWIRYEQLDDEAVELLLRP